MKNQILEWNRSADAWRAKTFTDAMSRTAAGVCVVTTNGPAGRFGLTVSSMVSVSAEPPRLLVCINRSSIAHDAVLANGRFAINVLAAVQRGIAAAFAGRSANGCHYRFDADDWTDLAALPRLRDCSAWFRCAVDSTLEAGTHTIIIGSVERSESGADAALLYTNRNYCRPWPLADTARATGTNSVLERSIR
jgi:flavin reductase (DIM6/NTAB) family NADH-FMN oxidoreductase RutF